jgi:peroxiredoxin
MSLTESTMPKLGSPAPDFHLPDAAGALHSLNDFSASPALLIAFICNHCPYVIHIKQAFAEFAREYAARGLAVVAVNSNDFASYPADAPDKMQQDACDYDYVFPYLVDEAQELAKACRAACTPDFFLYDGARKLRYCGRFDGASPGRDVPVTGAELRAAADALLAGQSLAGPGVPSIGCNIKWQPGNAPDYYG